MNRLIKRLMISKVLIKTVFGREIRNYILATLIVFLSAGICFVFTGYIGYQSVSFILLFVVSILSIFMGIGPIMLASTLSALIWNFFFIPPRFTINIEKTEDALMLGMFFIIALVNGILTSRVRKQEELAREREARTSALYQLTRELSGSAGLDDLAGIAVRNIKSNFGIIVILLIRDNFNNLVAIPGNQGSGCLSPDELMIADRVHRESVKAGRFTERPGNTSFTFYPLPGNTLKPGVMAVRHPENFTGNNDDFWDNFVRQISSAAERELLNDLAMRARFLDESDKLYKTLFNSISHELRIPVAAIMSASESLTSTKHPEDIRNELSDEIFKASARLNRLIENLLNMSRLESGHISPKPDWCDINDLINKAANDLADELRPFELLITVSENMPLVKIDFGLIENVLYNLLYNSTLYASGSSVLQVTASYENGNMILEVLDQGPGFDEREIPLIFNKFFRGAGSVTGGTGLGLSIARGFIEAHKGNIRAENRETGGARFVITIPSERPDMEIKE
jgi:K+-sensing histidine kinase KdpD